MLEGINDRLGQRSHLRQIYRCSPYHQNSAFYPIIALLERWLRFREEDSPEERLSKIEDGLEEYGFKTSEAVAITAAWLSVPLDDRYPSLGFSPQVKRQKTVQLALMLVTSAAARQSPMLVVWEDLHWADPSTLEFLDLLIEQVATARVLVMLTFRPEFVPPWGHRGHLTQISLNRLPRRLATDMMTRVTGGKELPEEVVSQIAAKSDGVPLFVEELTQMVIESDLLREVDGSYELSGPLPALAIPSTLQDSLTARLDRLSSVRESVQLAVVLGREFNYGLIRDGQSTVKRLHGALIDRNDQRRKQPDRRETRIYGAGHRSSSKDFENLGDCAKPKVPDPRPSRPTNHWGRAPPFRPPWISTPVLFQTRMLPSSRCPKPPPHRRLLLRHGPLPATVGLLQSR